MAQWSWSGAAQGGHQGASAGSAAGPWGALAGGVGGALMGGLTAHADGRTNRHFRESLDDIWQREQRRFNWYRQQGLHPLTIMGGQSYSPSVAQSSSGAGNVRLDGFMKGAESYTRARANKDIADTNRRLANAEIDERQASAARHRAEARLADSNAIRTATSRTQAGKLNSQRGNAEGPALKVFGGDLYRAPGATDAEIIEERYAEVLSEAQGVYNAIADSAYTAKKNWPGHKKMLQKFIKDLETSAGFTRLEKELGISRDMFTRKRGYRPAPKRRKSAPRNRNRLPAIRAPRRE